MSTKDIPVIGQIDDTDPDEMTAAEILGDRDVFERLADTEFPIADDA